MVIKPGDLVRVGIDLEIGIVIKTISNKDLSQVLWNITGINWEKSSRLQIISNLNFKK